MSLTAFFCQSLPPRAVTYKLQTLKNSHICDHPKIEPHWKRSLKTYLVSSQILTLVQLNCIADSRSFVILTQTLKLLLVTATKLSLINCTLFWTGTFLTIWKLSRISNGHTPTTTKYSSVLTKVFHKTEAM